MKTLVIAEKPSVAREIAKVLNCSNKKDGYLVGKDYIVTWAIGHLVTLAMPEDYNEELKNWKMEDLPIIPEEMKLKPAKSTKKQYSIVKRLLNSKDINEIVNACDAGREGELIFRYLYQLSSCTKPVKRLWISSLTNQAIKEGFSKLKNGQDYDNLYHAARCRSEADWLVGLNATRAFTVKYGTMLSVGRVQTPTLAIMVNREKEIQNFSSRNFWEIEAHFGSFTGLWQNPETETGELRTFDKAQAENVKNKVERKTGIVTDVKQDEKRELPPLLYDLTELQRDGNKVYGFSAQKILKLAQGLYETKLITYPRTDSRYLSSDIELEPVLKNLRGFTAFKEYVDKLDTANLYITKRIVNNEKISDHHAIIPTIVRPDKLSEEQNKIYDLVARRFIAVFYLEHKYMTTVVTSEVEEEKFITKGKTILQKGWKELYPSKKKEEQELPVINKGDSIIAQDVKISQKKTQPPKRYTESSLLSAMEGAGRFIDDEELKEQLKEKGLGTPATRAAIIEKLLKVGYIERQKKTLLPTKKGVVLVEIVPEKLKSPVLTGTWEKKLNDIRYGRLDAQIYMAEIREYTKEVVQAEKGNKANSSIGQGQEPIGKCPVCGAEVIKNKAGYGCSSWRETGCSFFLGKIAGKRLTVKQAKELLEKNETGPIKGFVSKKGKKFEAKLALKEGKIEFVFPKKGESLCK